MKFVGALQKETGQYICLRDVGRKAHAFCTVPLYAATVVESHRQSVDGTDYLIRLTASCYLSCFLS